MNEPRRGWWPVAGWIAVLLIATSLPGQDVPDVGPPGVDKLVHFLLYAPLGWLVVRALGRNRRLPGPVLGALAVLGGAAFAAADEWHQQFIPNRSCEFLDWLTDLLGIVIGSALGWWRATYVRRPTMGTVPVISSEELAVETSAPGILLVEFFTDGCPACARFGPTYEQLATEYEGRARLVKLNARQNMELAKAMLVRGVPTTVVYRDGVEAQRITGAKTLQEMREWLAPVLQQVP